MNETFSLVELMAERYPAAKTAYGVYEVRQGYTVGQAAKLDWTAILLMLHEKGYVVPGPTIGRTSYWRLTSRWEGYYFDLLWDLKRLVGRAWAEAAILSIYRSSNQGPTLLRKHTACESHHEDDAPRYRYAFRLLDEPTPWLKTRKPRLRLVEGRTPERWRTLPWIVPTDLDDRVSPAEERAAMLERMRPADRQDQERIDEIVQAFNHKTTMDDILIFIAELRAIIENPERTEIESSAYAALGIAVAYKESNLTNDILKQIEQLTSDDGEEVLKEIEAEINEITGRNLRNSLHETLLAKRNAIK